MSDLSEIEYKLVVLGAGGVGKSCIVIRYFSGHYVSEYDPTVEDSYRKLADVDNETCMLEITDTAGQQEYEEIRERESHKRGNGYLLVYSVIAKASLGEITKYHQSVLRWKKCATFPMVLIGNKMDLELDREVPTKDGEKLAETLGIPFFETSPKENKNIDLVFQTIVRQMRSHTREEAAKKPTTKRKPKCLMM